MVKTTTTIPFIERRRHQRLMARGAACAVASDSFFKPTLANLQLVDLSDGGLSATSLVEWPLAQSVTVLLPPGSVPGHPPRTCAGRVVRCRPTAGRYELAVAFDQPPSYAG